MLKLQRFIDALYPQELERIRTLSLSGKQAVVMAAFVAAYRDHSLRANRNAVLAGFSDSHRHQITSVLLRRAMSQLAPAGGIAALELLARKQLPVVFRGEFRRIEKEILATGDPKLVREFYYKASILLHRFARQPLEAALIRRCRERFAAAVKRNRAELLAFDGAALAAEIPAIVRSGANPQKSIELVERKIHAYSKKITADGDARARYYEAVAYAQFHFWKNYNATAFAGSIKRAKKLLRTIEIPYADNEQMRLSFALADALMASGKTREAYEAYSELFHSIAFSDPLWDEPFYLLRYAELALTSGEYEEAARILATYCTYLPYVLPSYASTHLLLIRAVLHVLRDELDAVPALVTAAYQTNAKSGSKLFADLRIRIIECAVFTLRRDTAMVDVLVDRALQSLRSKRLGVTKYNAGKFFLLLRAISRHAASDTAIPDELVEAYARYTNGSFGMFGRLLEHIRTSLGVEIGDS